MVIFDVNKTNTDESPLQAYVLSEQALSLLRELGAS